VRFDIDAGNVLATMMMMSLIRSGMCTQPASSTRTMSPVCNHPSTIVSAFVPSPLVPVVLHHIRNA